MADQEQVDNMEWQGTSVSSGFTTSTGTKSTSPSQRPSYCDYSSTSGLYPPQHSFDAGVIKQLDFPDESMRVSSASNNNSVNVEDEKLKTFLRIRPLFDISNSQSVLEIKDEHTIVASINRRNAVMWQDGSKKQMEFKFTKVLGPECGQSTVFEECVTPMIEKFMKHENCLIFSYGATNSGKTYTMQGHGTEYGIIPRTLDAIFGRIHDHQYKILNIRPHLYQAFQHLSQQEVDALCEKREKIIAEANIKQEIMKSYRLTTSGFSDRSGSTVELIAGGNLYDFHPATMFNDSTLYSVWVSYAELYNERVFDLLESSTVGKGRRRKELKLMQDRNGYVYIKDLTEVPVTSDEEAYKVFLAGRKNLQFAATQMNDHSSRSHSFFTIRVVSIGIGDGMVPYPKTVHRMTFCDLAGMERANQTENRGYRLQESGNINNSLTVLLKVIRVLREKQTNNHGHAMIETVPFRESKLTHIFKSYFTSATHICMVVNVNPDPVVAESTIQVLQNSAIASNVVVFRQVEHDTKAQPLQQVELNGAKKVVGKPPIPPNKNNTRARKGAEYAGERSSTCSDESGSSDEEDYAIQTVVAPKTMMQRLKILEAENERLKLMLIQCEAEKSKIREEALKLLNEQRNEFSNRLQKCKVTEENYHLRRLSLMRHQTQLSPASRCGRCSPPVADMEDIEETLELEEKEDEESYLNDSDKENSVHI